MQFSGMNRAERLEYGGTKWITYFCVCPKDGSPAVGHVRSEDRSPPDGPTPAARDGEQRSDSFLIGLDVRTASLMHAAAKLNGIEVLESIAQAMALYIA